MPAVRLEKEGNLYTYTLCEGNANTFHENNIQEFLDAVDEIEATKDNCAVILTAEDPKFFSAGINLDFIKEKGVPYLKESFLPKLDLLLMRMALLNAPVVAAVNGHAYGGGSLLASCADFRFMNADTGNFCFPEVDIKLPFTPAMQQVVEHLPDRNAVLRMALTGVAYTGPEADAANIIEAAVPADQLIAKATEMASMLAEKDRRTYTAIKRELKRGMQPVLDSLTS